MKYLKTLCLSLLILTSSTLANTWPSKPIKFVTNLPVGSGPDVFIRKVANELEKKYTVPVLVENRPGASGILALEYYLSLPADGYSIFVGDFGTMVIMPILYDREQQINQLAPLTNTYITRWMIVTSPSINTWADLRNAVTKNPRFGSTGIGSGSHLCGQELSNVLGIETLHVPYKELGQWFMDISNGIIPFGCTTVGSSQTFHKAGRLNYVATTGNQRDVYYPAVPTVKELTDVTFQTGEAWVPFYINKKVNATIANNLEKDLREIVNSDIMKDQVKFLGGIIWAPTSKELAKVREKENKNYKDLIKKFNISVK
jgi:tripartite-type tricarboxylate transporter receptor subunit TctC